MFRNFRSRPGSFGRRNKGKSFPSGRSLRYETMEGRLVLSASGFAGNECAPELNDAALDAIVPSQIVSADTLVAFQFAAADVVSDAGAGATPVADIHFELDPDLGSRLTGATPEGATLSFNETSSMWEFAWTPTTAQVGTYRLFIIATDDGGANNVPLSDAYSFDLIVDARQTSVDLNGDSDPGIDFGPVSFTEADNSTPVAIVDTDASIFVAGGGGIESLTVEIASPQDDTNGRTEFLAVTADAALEVNTDDNGRLVITVVGGGTADKSLFEDALRTLTYNNTSDSPETTRNISVVVNDGTNDSPAAMVTVNITATNDRPDLETPGTLPEATVGQEYVLDLVASDPDGPDLLVFRIVSGPDGAVISPNALPPDGSDNTIQVSRDQDGFYRAQISWTPTPEQENQGVGSFLVSVTDTGGLADTELYEITIGNQAPVANDDPTAGEDPFSVSEDASATGGSIVGNILLNDTDAEGDALTVQSVTAGGQTFPVGTAFTHPTSNAKILVSASGQVVYNPNKQYESLGAGETATDTFEYNIVDEHGNTAGPATVTITILGENDPPTAVAGVVPSVRMNEDAGATEIPLATLLTAVEDVDANDTHSIVEVPVQPDGVGGFFELNGGVLTFNPDGDFDVARGSEESFEFMVKIQDSSNAEVTITARIVIDPVNEAPVAVDDMNISVGEDALLDLNTRALGVLGNDTDDTDPATLLVAEVNGSAANVGTPIMISDGSGRMGELTVAADGSFTFDPRGNFDSLILGGSSTVTFTYKATDGEASNNLSNEATVTISVFGLNDAPTANAITVAAVEDGPTVDGNFDGEDLDDGETATLDYAITVQPTEGSVTNNDDGTFTFDPQDDFQDLAEGITRDVTFNYTATDAQGIASAEAIATVTVTGVNDAPEFDLNETDGLASILPTGQLTSPGVINLQLDLSSSDPLVNQINMLDIPAYASDLDGDALTFTLASGDNGGTPFRATNRPSLGTMGRLTWVPTSEDLGNGYIIRVNAADGAPNNPLSSSFDLVVSVMDSALTNPEVVSVSGVNLSETVRSFTIEYSKPMDMATVLDSANYGVTVADGGLSGTAVIIEGITAGPGNSVVVELDSAAVSLASGTGGTQLRLVLSTDIEDQFNNMLDGQLEHLVDLVSPVA